MEEFFTGMHRPNFAEKVDRAFISINVLRTKKGSTRRKRLKAKRWVLDSGAFTELKDHGKYRHSVAHYANSVNQLARKNPEMVCAVSQDYMCEPFILDRTGLTVVQHQELTIQRYIELRDRCPSVYIMPVLQGYEPWEYVQHIEMYGELLAYSAWVGVGSVCKRNVNIGTIREVLFAIKRKRPDLRLHGFGLKITALADRTIRELLHSADSMAWSRAERWAGRDPNAWYAAAAFEARMNAPPPELRFDQTPSLFTTEDWLGVSLALV